MALNPQHILAQMDQLQVTYFEDLAKNNDKFRALWASCSQRGHMFIFSFESVAQKLLQQRNISEVLDDMIITILVVEWYLKQIGYPTTVKIREQINGYQPNTPPNWLMNKYQNQEMLIKYIDDTNTFWFNQASLLHQLLGQGYQPKNLVEMARSFREAGQVFNHVTNSLK